MDIMANMQGMAGMIPNQGIPAEALNELQKNMLKAEDGGEDQDEELDGLSISLFDGDQDIDGDYMLGDYYGDDDYDEAMARAEAAEAEIDDILGESELEGNEAVTEEKLGDLQDEMSELELEKEEKLKEKEEVDAEIERKMDRYVELQEMVDSFQGK